MSTSWVDFTYTFQRHLTDLHCFISFWNHSRSKNIWQLNKDNSLKDLILQFVCSKIFSEIIWSRCNLKRSRRTVIVLPVYKISSLKITPPKTPNSGQFSYPLRNIISFLFEKNIDYIEFWFRSRDFSFNLFPVWEPYCWRFWSAIVRFHTSTINARFGSALKSMIEKKSMWTMW